MLEYYPVYVPYFTDQYTYISGAYISEEGWYEVPSCVANTLSTLAEIFDYRENRVSQKKSIVWIYGNRASYHRQEEGMEITEALDKMIADGVPSYNSISGNRFYTLRAYFYNNQNYYYYDLDSSYYTAKQAVIDNYSSLITEAREHDIDSYTTISSISDIKSAILRYGAVVLKIESGDPLWDVDSDGIVYDNNGYIDWFYHTMPIIGWKEIDGKLHWIGHNGWGQSWGDKGWCYIPYDSQHIMAIYKVLKSSLPSTIRPTNWTWKSYELDAFNNNRDVTFLTSARWNEFIQAIKAFMAYKGISDNSITAQQQIDNNLVQTGQAQTYETLINLAKMGSDDKTLYARKFNTIRYCIGSMNSTGINTKTAGSDVLGADFITLSTKLNQIS